MTTPGLFMAEQLQQFYYHGFDQKLSSHDKQARTKLKYVIKAHTMRDLPCTIACPQNQ
jgi:plasmid maintenance system killer protein